MDTILDDLTQRSLDMLAGWAKAAERHWYPLPGHPGLGCYGTGYNAWGVQTNQKYLAAMAVLAGRRGGGSYLERALAALRFSLQTHLTGRLACTDGTQWGHTWISALGIERMMHAVHLLGPHLTEADRDLLRAVLTSEADWLVQHYERNGIREVTAGMWESSGRNQPESNVWNGALLWRTAALYPDDPRADRWRERAHLFLVNAISVPDDAEDGTVLAGMRVKDRFRGANFFPHYALDHRGFMNVGYTVICVAGAAMLHFDLRLAGLKAPETLHHHQADLWRVLRRMVFSDGRLARIGGATRIRYSYCQEYLLPSLLYAADHHGDRPALGPARAYLETAAREQAASGEGSFYGARLAELARRNLYYTTRVESDRACALGMVAVYAPLIKRPPAEAEAAGKTAGKVDREAVTLRDEFERSGAGSWREEEHGTVLHRCPTRLASFAWRAQGLTQGMCQPPGDGHLAEWERNLAGMVRVMQHRYDSGRPRAAGFGHTVHAPGPPDRRLLSYGCRTFEGGFVTWGSVMEGVDAELAEGWFGTDSAVHRLVFAALPDGHTVLGLQLCRAADRRVYFREIQGLHLNLPNDVFNGYSRTLAAEPGTMVLKSPPESDGILSLDSRWANIDGRLSVIGLYGAESLQVSRSQRRRGGVLRSLFVEEIGWPARREVFAAEPGTVVLDAAWMVCASVDAEATRRLAHGLEESGYSPPAARATGHEGADVRAVQVTGVDGRRYSLWANFGDEPAVIPAPRGVELDGVELDGDASSQVGRPIAPDEARLYAE